MDKDSLLILIEKYLNEEATPAEKKWVENWYTGFDAGADWLEAGSERAGQVREELRQSLLYKLNGLQQLQVVEQQVFSIRKKQRWAWAAAILLLLGGSMLFYFLYHGDRTNEQMLVMEATNVPLTATLPDSSVVWLQPHSRLHYPADFSNHQRTVVLEGTALFEVVARPQPFVVNSGRLSTHVLGTTFSVQSGQTDSIAITVLEGKVAVSRDHDALGTLEASDRLIYYSHSGTCTIGKANRLQLQQVQPQEVLFDNQTLWEVTMILTQWYGYTFQVQDASIMEERYTGSVNRRDHLDDLLNTIHDVNHINYHIDHPNKRVILNWK